MTNVREIVNWSIKIKIGIFKTPYLSKYIIKVSLQSIFIREEIRESYKIFSVVSLNKRDFCSANVTQRYSFKVARILCATWKKDYM